MAISREQVLQSLQKVKDPDLGRDLVSLKMIEDIRIDGSFLSFTVVLTTPACPLKDQIKSDCINTLKADINTELDITVNFDSRVTTRRTDKKELLPGVKNIIAVASGKGGVGKSTVSVNLALSLAKNGSKVGIIDADIYGPSIPVMFGLKGERPKVQELDGKHYIIPIEKYGVHTLSIGFLVDERQAIVWRGPMVSSALKQFVTDCIWGDLDYLILDMPPGTGDVHLTMVQTIPVTGAIIVTTPQAVALADARKAVSMFNMDAINVPVLGVVENMSYFTPKELPDNKYYLFGTGGGKKIADEYEIPVLGQIPIVQGIREGGDTGTPVVETGEPISSAAFHNLAVNTERYIAIRNAQLEASKPVEIMTQS